MEGADTTASLLREGEAIFEGRGERYSKHLVRTAMST